MTNSPLISNGKLSLTNTGDLVFAPDIQTQMLVSISAYKCIYDALLNSELITYLDSIQIGGINPNAIDYIIQSAYQSLISANIITNLKISTTIITQNTIVINITAADSNGQPVSLKWDNIQ